MAPHPRTIIVVGGGFSGTVLAANLLRSAPANLRGSAVPARSALTSRPEAAPTAATAAPTRVAAPTGATAAPTRVVLIERRAEVGRGVAYAARAYPYLLNVPADRMSATSADPDSFVKFLRRRHPSASARDFVPRELYGDYLQDLLANAERAAPPHVRLERVHADVIGIARLERAGPLRIALGDGRVLLGDDVVLACGNPPPANPAGTEALIGHPRYVSDACRDSRPPRYHGTVLLLGTGLTMADVAMAAAERTDATLHALSRRGLLPLTQSVAQPQPHASSVHAEAALLTNARSLRALLRAARELAHEAERQGGGWQDVVTAIRNRAPELWQRLPERERRRFLRHVRPYWDIHRHRLPPAAAERIAELRRNGRLQVHAGHIRQARPEGTRIRVTWRPRGGGAARSLLFDWVVNCTGPDYDLRRSTDPLFRAALRAGLVVPDECGLGLKTGTCGAVIDARGRPSPDLHYLGPMLRAGHWEATAVAELRAHAEALAAHLVGDKAQWLALPRAQTEF